MRRQLPSLRPLAAVAWLVVCSGGAAAAETAGDAAQSSGGGHADPFSPILIGLVVLLLAALLGRWAAAKVGQPSVLGELVMGVALGNVGYAFGWSPAVVIMHLESVVKIFERIWGSGLPVREAAGGVFGAAELAPGGAGAHVVQLLTGDGGSGLVTLAFSVWVFSNLGIVLLLFVVGLESSIDEMVQVGPRAALVAVVGIVLPFVLGYASSAWLLPGEGQPVHLFLGATLTATSVGITARVFKDLKRIHTGEAKVILGAAVIDDILGLIILAVVAGIVATGELRFGEVGRIALLSVLFLGGLMLLGEWIARFTGRAVGVLDRIHGKLLLPLILAFAMAWAANQIQLASIVGAFAAGLILNEEHFRGHSERQRKVEEMVEPVEAIFAPIFFVLMGMQVNLRTFAEPRTVLLAGAFVAVAIAGKLVAGLPAGRGIDRLSVGIGMVPRGEVGLIFASIGKGMGVVNDAVFSAVVIMVMVTTLITPIGLKWSLTRQAASVG